MAKSEWIDAKQRSDDVNQVNAYIHEDSRQEAKQSLQSRCEY